MASDQVESERDIPSVHANTTKIVTRMMHSNLTNFMDSFHLV